MMSIQDRNMLGKSCTVAMALGALTIPIIGFVMGKNERVRVTD